MEKVIKPGNRSFTKFVTARLPGGGWELRQLSESSGVPLQTLYNWAYGRSKTFHGEQMIRVLDALGYKLTITKKPRLPPKLRIVHGSARERTGDTRADDRH